MINQQHHAAKTQTQGGQSGLRQFQQCARWVCALMFIVGTGLGLPGDSSDDEALVLAPAGTWTNVDAGDQGVRAWHLDKLHAADAWKASHGQGVTIAIIDSGVDAEHPDLKGRVLPGWNVMSDKPDTVDTRGHGTAVAGAAAAGFNQAMGASGMATQARILPLKVTDERGYTSVGAVVKAIYRAADQGAQVVNVSFEFVAGHPAVIRAAEYLQAKGGVLVVPAGNRGIQQNFAASPAVMTVAATNQNDGHPQWSSRGSHISVSAPGQDLMVSTLGGQHGQVSGTSYASPLVAGVLALMWAHHPQATPQELRQALEMSAVDLGEPGHDPVYGHGRVDAHAALEALSQLRQGR